MHELLLLFAHNPQITTSNEETCLQDILEILKHSLQNFSRIPKKYFSVLQTGIYSKLRFSATKQCV